MVGMSFTYGDTIKSNLKSMKKIKLLLATIMLMGAVAVYAQDTTGVSGGASKDRKGPGLGAQGQNVGDRVLENQSQDYRKDMTVIQAADVPASLRSTLAGDQYKGWESNATIYSSKNNDSYVVEIREGNETKVHRFDQNGKAVKEY
jgi:hypothetical protein